MGFLTIIAMLLPLILKLIEWLSSGKELGPKQLKKLNHVLAKCNELRAVAAKHGAKAQLDPDEE